MTLAALVFCVLGSVGNHQRWETPNGPIHTWYPGSAVPSKAVLYVHGYYDSADSAFEGHRLAAQFESSGVDALFVVPEAPSGAGQKIAWPQLELLLAEVATHLGVPLPTSVLLLGHSGGNRTIKGWLSAPIVDRVVLLDAFYGDASPLQRWLEARVDARLVIVSQSTAPKADAWLARLTPSMTLRISHRRATCSHMQIVTAGRWIPDLVRELDGPAVL